MSETTDAEDRRIEQWRSFERQRAVLRAESRLTGTLVKVSHDISDYCLDDQHRVCKKEDVDGCECHCHTDY